MRFSGFYFYFMQWASKPFGVIFVWFMQQKVRLWFNEVELLHLSAETQSWMNVNGDYWLLIEKSYTTIILKRHFNRWHLQIWGVFFYLHTTYTYNTPHWGGHSVPVNWCIISSSVQKGGEVQLLSRLKRPSENSMGIFHIPVSSVCLSVAKMGSLGILENICFSWEEVIPRSSCPCCSLFLWGWASYCGTLYCRSTLQQFVSQTIKIFRIQKQSWAPTRLTECYRHVTAVGVSRIIWKPFQSYRCWSPTESQE